MNQLLEAFAWLADPSHYEGPNGIPVRALEHLGYSVTGVFLAAVIALPIGFYVGHTGKGRGIAVGASGAARALPTLGLVTLFGLMLGIGLGAPILALVILAIPSLLAGAYSACEAAPRSVVDAARAQGMSEMQILTRVELPIGAPLLVNGFRSATLQVIATAMLAAYIGNGGLGRYIFLGLTTQDYPQMLAGSLLVIALAVVLEAIGLAVQRWSTPRGVAAAS